MNIPLSRCFLSPISIILFYYTISIYKKGTLFPAPYLSCHFLSAPLFTFIYLYYIYSIYREEHTFPQLFTPFPTVLLYSLYIEEETFSPPLFYPSYKVNTFSTATFLTLIVWGKVCGEKVFENFISIVL